jgi:hypothetical protein
MENPGSVGVPASLAKLQDARALGAAIGPPDDVQNFVQLFRFHPGDGYLESLDAVLGLEAYAIVLLRIKSVSVCLPIKVVLNKKYHQIGNYRGSGVYYQLPRIKEVEKRTSCPPYQD